MKLDIQEIIGITKKVKEESELAFSNLMESVYNHIHTTALKGINIYTADINVLTNAYMSPQTKYSEVCSKLKSVLEDEGYICKEIEGYKSVSLSIEWPLDDNEYYRDFKLNINDIKCDYNIEYNKKFKDLNISICYCELGRSGKLMGYGLRAEFKDKMIFTATSEEGYEPLVNSFNNFWKGYSKWN